MKKLMTFIATLGLFSLVACNSDQGRVELAGDGSADVVLMGNELNFPASEEGGQIELPPPHSCSSYRDLNGVCTLCGSAVSKPPEKPGSGSYPYMDLKFFSHEVPLYVIGVPAPYVQRTQDVTIIDFPLEGGEVMLTICSTAAITMDSNVAITNDCRIKFGTGSFSPYVFNPMAFPFNSDTDWSGSEDGGGKMNIMVYCEPYDGSGPNIISLPFTISAREMISYGSTIAYFEKDIYLTVNQSNNPPGDII